MTMVISGYHIVSKGYHIKHNNHLNIRYGSNDWAISWVIVSSTTTLSDQRISLGDSYLNQNSNAEYVMFQTRVCVRPSISRYRETSWKTRQSRVFLTSFEISINQRKNTKRAFEIASQTNQYFRRKSSRKWEKFSCNSISESSSGYYETKTSQLTYTAEVHWVQILLDSINLPPISKYWLIMHFFCFCIMNYWVWEIIWITSGLIEKVLYSKQ